MLSGRACTAAVSSTRFTSRSDLVDPSGGRAIETKTKKTAAGRPLEVDLWEAGADPDALLIGAAVSDGDTLRMNTIHIAYPTKRAETEIAGGLFVVSNPGKTP